MDEAYKDAMREHLAQLEEELTEIARLQNANGLNVLAYRAAERTIQLLIEACVGFAKQALKVKGLQVPGDAREAFTKLKSFDLDPTQADWNRIIGMRNALVHDYLNIQADLIVEVVRKQQYKVLFEFARYHLR